MTYVEVPYETMDHYGGVMPSAEVWCEIQYQQELELRETIYLKQTNAGQLPTVYLSMEDRMYLSQKGVLFIKFKMRLFDLWQNPSN